jgi:transposase
MVISSIEPERFVFVDECSSNTSLAPLYGWSRRAERVHQKAPRNWGKNITLLSSIGKKMGMGASLVVEGSTNRAVFEIYLEDVLCPTLERGQVVVMDNLSSHKGEKVKQLIEARGCFLIYLPPYSPDFNPIEQAFSKLKSYLREACARTQQTLIWSLSAKRSIRSPFRMPRASSHTVATGRWFNLYDSRCRHR